MTSFGPSRPLAALARLLPLALAALLVLASATPAQAQDEQPSRQEILTHYSLYFENWKAENWADALPDLRWMLENAPAEPKDDDRNYDRAVDVYKGLAEGAEGDTRAAYLDTAWTYLNRAVPDLQALDAEIDPYEWELEKGRFLQQFGNDVPGHSADEAPTYYRQAYDMAPERVDAYYIDRVVQYYFDESEQDRALEFLDQVAEERADDEAVMNVVEQRRNQVFGRDPAARLRYLETQYEAHPDSLDLATDLFEAYLDQEYREEAADLADTLLDQPNPPLEVYRQVARLRMEDGRYQEALELMQRAEADGLELAAEDYFNMGRAQYQLDQLAAARRYYRQALDLRSDFGQAYLAIGDVYAKAVANCGGSAMEREDKAVYWLVVDYYQRAKSVDPSVEQRANAKIQTYAQYFPSAEDVFYRSDWSKGASYRIDQGCYAWIGESTTVRTSS